MSVQKDGNGAIQKKRVKNKITGQTYEEHGHLSDTMRYVVVDFLRDEFILFSNRRKRNLYAQGTLQFFNPATMCNYSNELVYCMPNINGKFVLVFGKKCGESWHVVKVGFMETTSTEDIMQTLTQCDASRIILECSKSYYLMARKLSDYVKAEVRVVKENTDIPKRIAATSDFVKKNILFSETMTEEDNEYGMFINNLLDYNRDANESYESSAAVSGFSQAILKLGL